MTPAAAPTRRFSERAGQYVRAIQVPVPARRAPRQPICERPAGALPTGAERVRSPHPPILPRGHHASLDLMEVCGGHVSHAILRHGSTVLLPMVLS